MSAPPPSPAPPPAAHGPARKAAPSPLPPLLPSLLVLGCAVLLVLALRHASPGAATKPLAAVQAALRNKHRFNESAELTQICHQLGCPCLTRATRAAFDAEALAEARVLLGVAGTSCKADPALPGLAAELAARLRDASAAAQADRVLQASPNDGSAAYARALVEYRAGHAASALLYATRAIAAGRGNAARALRGLIAFQVNNLELAVESFSAILSNEPEDVDAHYNRALAYQLQNKYREARTEYLMLTHIDPTHKDARYNLAILANSIGATDEARHHLERLRQLAPDDERVTRLRAILAPRRSLPFSASPSPSSSASP